MYGKKNKRNKLKDNFKLKIRSKKINSIRSLRSQPIVLGAALITTSHHLAIHYIKKIKLKIK